VNHLKRIVFGNDHDLAKAMMTITPEFFVILVYYV
jgi:hypothetical protein